MSAVRSTNRLRLCESQQQFLAFPSARKDLQLATTSCATKVAGQTAGQGFSLFNGWRLKVEPACESPCREKGPIGFKPDSA